MPTVYHNISCTTRGFSAGHLLISPLFFFDPLLYHVLRILTWRIIVLKITGKRVLTNLERFILMTLGVVLTAIGVYFFKFPNNFTTGGVSGISLILSRILVDPLLTPGMVMLLINVALLIVGYLFLGRGFALSTVYCSMLLSVLTALLEKVCPMNAPMTSEPLLELCFAVLLPAVGSALLFNVDASSGGTDIIAMIVRKYTHMNIGMALMIADAMVTMAAFLIFGPKTGLYSILGLLSKSRLVDYFTDAFRSRKCFQIVTETPQPIVDFITRNLNRGATLEDVHGAFSGRHKTMIITVLTRTQALQLRKYIHTVDPHAFMVITTSTEIVGNGFLAS